MESPRQKKKLRAMKFQLLSDLHLEFLKPKEKLTVLNQWVGEEVDALILAGDIDTMSRIEESLSFFCGNFHEVIYVTGNHEYYKSSFNEVFDKLSTISSKLSNLHWLEDSEVTIKDQRFLGGTLWFEENRQTTDPVKQAFLNDFRLIKGFKETVFSKHEKTKKFLLDNTQPGDVVVTHHLPHPYCTSLRFINDPYNCFFTTDMEHIIESNGPSYWLFGHTHDSVDTTYETGYPQDTRMMANPYGYHTLQTNKKHNPYLIIEV
jgi:predicted phosphodiesterase